MYLIAQLAGAIVAALAAWALFGASARSVAHLGATAPAAGVGAWRAFGAEAFVTFVLVLVVVSVATDNRVPPGVAAVAIGAALGAAILVAGPISGGAVNPARSIGPMIVAGTFTDWWVYLTGPVVGESPPPRCTARSSAPARHRPPRIGPRDEHRRRRHVLTQRRRPYTACGQSGRHVSPRRLNPTSSRLKGEPT